MALLLLNFSLVVSLAASTENLKSRPLHVNEDVQSATHDQIYHQRAQTRDKLKVGESFTLAPEHSYLDGDFSDMTERLPDKYITDPAKGNLNNSKFEEKMKPIISKKFPINNRGDGVAVKIHKYSDAKSKITFFKDSGTNGENLFPKDLGAKGETTIRNNDDTPLVKTVSDVFMNGGWAIAKSTILETVNIIFHQDDSSVLENLKLFLDIGDKMYYAQSFVDKLDPSLIDFLYDHIRAQVIYLTNILKYFGLSSNGIDDWNNVERLFASKIGKTLITKAQNVMKDHLSLNDLKKYYTLLQENNPMAAQALDFVLNLFPGESHGEMGRYFYREEVHDSYERVDTKGDRHDDHYGGHGSYDSGYGHSGGGYGHETSHQQSYHQIDPYLLLAGLGAATLLSYIAYLVLTTMAAGGGGKKKRSLDFPGNQDLSDLPEVLYSINNMIETAEEKFGEEEEDSMDDLSSSLNSLWNTRQEEGCVRCALEDIVKGGLDRLSLQHLLV